MRSWTGEDYGANPVCQAVVQQPSTGLIYVGFNGGLLEFDGARWRIVSTAANQVRGFAIDRRGRVWFANVDHLGYLESDANGQMRAVTVDPRLPKVERASSLAVGLLAADGGIYYATRGALYFLNDSDDSPAQAWPLAGQVVTMWRADSAVHLSLQNGSWLRLRDGKPEPLAAAAPEVFAAAGQVLLTARGPFPAATENLLHGDTANSALVLADGRLVFGTERSGIIVCDRAGRFLQRIDRAAGLSANRVHGLCEDREGGVWVALHHGITRVQLDSPFAVHGLPQRFDSTPHAVQRVAGRLIVAHTEGISEAGADGMFSTLPDLPADPASGLIGGSPIFTSAVLQRTLPADIGAPSRDRTAYTGALQLASEPGVFVVGSYDGIWLCRNAGGKWENIGKVRQSARYTSVAIEAPAGFVWFVGPRGLTRLDVRAGARPNSPLRVYGKTEGLPLDRMVNRSALFRFDGSAALTLDGQLFRYDSATDRFAPETRLAGLPSPIPNGLPGGARLGEDPDGTLWTLFGPPTSRVQRVRLTAPGRWQAEPLDTTPLARLGLSGIYHDPTTESLWLSTQSGPLISMDLNWRSTRAPLPLAAVIRRIETLPGVFISSGATARVSALELPSARTSLRFHFAAPLFAPAHDGSTHLTYRTRLDGLETEWTAWSKESFREFTNLPWRTLTFRVQARDFTGRESAESTFAFVIAAPWWATRVAFLGYGVLGLASVSGIVRLRTRTLRQRAAALEATVAERTAELATQNLELTRLHRLELDEKTAATLAEEKTRLEMLRYQLNPHFLANSLAALRTLVGPSATGARDMIERLASFCRMALTRRDETATVRDEIEMLRAYLDTEKSRWRDMLDTTIEAAPTTLDLPLPPFLLLPLVENAIKYGGQTSPDVLRIRVAFALEPNGQLLITITNTGTWLAPDPTRVDSTGIGLDNIRQRLRRHYPDAHEFTTSEENGHVTARLRLKPNVGGALRPDFRAAENGPSSLPSASAPPKS